MHSQNATDTPIPVRLGSFATPTPYTSPDDHRDLLEDLDTILDEIAIFQSDTSSPSNMTFTDDEGPKKPTGNRTPEALADREDVTKITADNIRVILGKGSTPRLHSRDRLESWVDVEVRSPAIGKTTEKENRAFNSTGDDNKTKQAILRKGKKSPDQPVVWVIEPTYDLKQNLRFKFTADHGACLTLKAGEALESIEIMQEASRENTYFQVYSVDGTSSRVIRPQQIARSFNKIVSDSNPAPVDDVLSGHSTAKDKNRLDRRFYRFLLRRRWRKLVRRQVRLANASHRPSRLRDIARRLAKLWDRMTQRTEDEFASI
jgi:hypothetical protein